VSAAEEHPVLSREDVYAGRVISLHRDMVAMSDGSVAERDVVDHPGAVAVVALDESSPDEVRVVTVTQYRHPVGQRLTELPAGLLDVHGETALAAAQRELAEEAGLSAERWNVLVDLYTSAGMTNEAVRVYLARDLRSIGRPSDFELTHEEVSLTVEQSSLGDLVRAAYDGRLTNAIAVAGIMAAARVVDAGIDGAGRELLRDANAPWPARPDR
jgi:ADP-ribose pyrophosphatase